MIFNSYIFILLFLPVSVLGYHIINKTGKYCAAQYFLFIISLWFYSYTNIYYLPVILASICLNYIIYMLMKKNRFCKVLLITAISLNLGILFYFKYYNFFIDSANIILKTNLSIREILLPLGISFMTFQQIAFIVDVYKDKTKECTFREYALFIAFFPHTISGPIITYEDFIPLLRDENRRKLDWDRLAVGIYMFILGLGKKVLIADVFMKAVDYGYNSLTTLNTTDAIFISVAYTMQIYFDFSGYSDMAVGISKMLNFELPINFNSPYKAKTIIEFWDRWHMTLTRFFTKYLYIPLGGNRKGKTRTWVNTMIVFVCSGFWHGASWTFVLWGFLHGAFLVITKKFKQHIERIPGAINWVFTMLFVNATWILFRAGSFETFKEICRVLISNNWGPLNTEVCSAFKNFIWEWIPALPQWWGVCFYLILSIIIVFKCKNVGEKADKFNFSNQSGIFVIIILLLSILSFSDVSTYIYANF